MDKEKGREGGKEGEKDEELENEKRIPNVVYSCKVPWPPGLDQAEAKNRVFRSVLPCGWQGSSCLSHPPSASRVHMGQDLNPKHQYSAYNIPHSTLTMASNSHSWYCSSVFQILFFLYLLLSLMNLFLGSLFQFQSSWSHAIVSECWCCRSVGMCTGVVLGNVAHWVTPCSSLPVSGSISL